MKFDIFKNIKTTNNMPRHKKKNTQTVTSRQMIEKEEDTQEYARVIKALGSGRFSLRMNITGKEIQGKLRGNMRGGRRKRKNFVTQDALVLVCTRDFQDKVVDIVHLYTPEEERALKKSGELVEHDAAAEMRAEESDEVDETGFDFDEI